MSYIRPGDLVVVVRDCCGFWLGKVATVRAIRRSPEHECDECKALLGCGIYIAETDHHDMRSPPVSWLKKLDADAQPEDVQREEEIHA